MLSWMPLQARHKPRVENLLGKVISLCVMVLFCMMHLAVPARMTRQLFLDLFFLEYLTHEKYKLCLDSAWGHLIVVKLKGWIVGKCNISLLVFFLELVNSTKIYLVFDKWHWMNFHLWWLCFVISTVLYAQLNRKGGWNFYWSTKNAKYLFSTGYCSVLQNGVLCCIIPSPSSHSVHVSHTYALDYGKIHWSLILLFKCMFLVILADHLILSCDD